MENQIDNYMEDPKPEYRWPVVVSQPIKAPAEKVWDVISMPGNLEPCHPFCSTNPVQVWPGEGSRDKIHYLSGWIYERQFCRWIDGVGYDLEIGRSGGGKSFVSWRIKSLDNQNCRLKIAVYPHIRPMLRRYLSSVTRGFEWYISCGKPVPRNHFGEHPWFSAH
jgi:hypothetical protein